MKPATREWVEKAEGDFATAGRELRARKAPNFDAACFHAQQCAEKYLKALLQENGKRFGKVHHLGVLLDLVGAIDPAWESLRFALERLTLYAVQVRYPGERADKLAARDAVALAHDVRSRARRALRLKNGA